MAREFVRTHPDKIVYPHLAAVDGAAQMAIYLRAYVTGSSNYDCLVSQLGANGSGAGTVSGFEILHNGSDARDLYIEFRNNATAGDHIYSAADPLTLNAWNTIIVQFDGTEATATDRVKLYVNAGTVVSPDGAASSPTTLGTTDQPLLLGIRADGSLPWSGRQCEVAIWTGVVLTSGERTTLHAGDPADSVQPSALKFYAPLDSAYTSGVNDLVGPYTGTATGTSVVAHPTGVPTSAPGGGIPTAYDLPTDVGAYALAGGDALIYEYLARPSSTSAAGSWTAVPSGTLHGVTSDQTDATYAQSSTGATADTMVLGFPAMGVPHAGPVTFTVRHQKA